MVAPADVLNARVLVVDDPPADLLLLEGILRGAGYASITTAAAPQSVCDFYREQRHDLILLGLQLPGMDGFQVMQGLKLIETEGYLPLLVLTTQPGTELRALQAGAEDFIRKPFDPVELLARVYNLLELRLLHMQGTQSRRQPRSARRRTLLYVEDDAANLKLVEELIRRRPDMRLLSAQDASLGIALALAAQPEVILMDINLPGISGVDALKALIKNPATAHIPVVAVSAYAAPRDVAAGLKAGFFRYLTKPVRVDEFGEALTEALALSAQRTRPDTERGNRPWSLQPTS